MSDFKGYKKIVKAVTRKNYTVDEKGEVSTMVKITLPEEMYLYIYYMKYKTGKTEKEIFDALIKAGLSFLMED